MNIDRLSISITQEGEEGFEVIAMVDSKNNQDWGEMHQPFNVKGEAYNYVLKLYNDIFKGATEKSITLNGEPVTVRQMQAKLFFD